VAVVGAEMDLTQEVVVIDRRSMIEKNFNIVKRLLKNSYKNIWLVNLLSNSSF